MTIGTIISLEGLRRFFKDTIAYICLIEDSKIISHLRESDPKGLRAAYDKYGKALYGVILRIVKNPGLAEEILQDTFMKLWTKVDRYDPEKSVLFTWLMSIARNNALDAVRLKKYEHNQKTDSLDITVHDSEGNANGGASIDVSALANKLDEKYRVLLDMMYLQGYSQSEIAKELDIPLGTVKTRLRSAMSQLRDTLRSEKSLFIGSIIVLLLLLIIASL